jgi:PAS domain S-box-containing protein
MTTHRDAAESSGGGAAEARWRHLIEHIQDAVVEFELVDGVPTVRSVNRAFVDVFGYDRAAVEGQPLNDHIVPRWLTDEAAALDARTASGEVNYRQVKRETADGLREFLYRGIPYDIDGTRTDGFAVYTDLTEVHSYERQFDVLNRLLRHNLRTQTNVILGHTTRLVEELADGDGEPMAAAARIEAAAEDLRALTREATHIRKVLRETVPSDAVLDCASLVERIGADYRRATAAAVTVERPGTAPVRATSHLRTALDALVDNAIRHNPADTPRVGLRVEPIAGGDWVDIHVDDDGPHIPATERAVVEDHAETTPVNHGTGLGLWLAKLTTESFGGDLSIDRSPWDGNRVTLRLQRA